MEPNLQVDPTVLIIFGAAGDLTQRKLVPALYNLYLDRWLREPFAIVGLDRKPLEPDAFRAQLRQGVRQFSRRPPTTSDWDQFATHLGYLPVDFGAAESYKRVAETLG